MKLFKIALLMAVLAVASIASSSAHLIDLGLQALAAELGNPTAETNYVQTNFNGGNPLTFLTKEGGGSFSGAGDNPAILNGQNFISVTNGPTTSTLSWNLAGSGFKMNFVLVKDGQNDAGLFLYHVYSVSADEVFNSITPQIVQIDGVKTISHITFLGNPGTPSVPDGGTTAILLGLSFTAIEVVRRRLASKRA